MFKKSLLFVLFFYSSFALAQETKEFQDSTGRTLALPENISRIVPTGPASQMMLLSFAPEKLVGLAIPLSEEVEKTFPIAKDLPVFGQFYGNANLNKEALLASNPQVIVDIGEPKKNVTQDMENLTTKLGIPAVHIEARLNNMPNAFLMLGQLLNKEEKATEISTYLQEVYEKIQTFINSQKEKRPSVLYLLGTKGTHVLSKGSFHAQVIDMIGENKAELSKLSASGNGSEVSLEQILIWNPDVLIYAPKSAYEKVPQTPALQTLNAVKNKRVYEAPAYPFDWISTPPAVNRYMGLIWLSTLLYPEQSPFDLQEETNKFYRLFYGQEFDFLNKKEEAKK